MIGFSYNSRDFILCIKHYLANSLAVQWLGLCALAAEDLHGTKILQAAQRGQKIKKDL